MVKLTSELLPDTKVPAVPPETVMTGLAARATMLLPAMATSSPPGAASVLRFEVNVKPAENAMASSAAFSVSVKEVDELTPTALKSLSAELKSEAQTPRRILSPASVPWLLEPWAATLAFKLNVTGVPGVTVNKPVDSLAILTRPFESGENKEPPTTVEPL